MHLLQVHGEVRPQMKVDIPASPLESIDQLEIEWFCSKRFDGTCFPVDDHEIAFVSSGICVKVTYDVFIIK